MSVPRLQRYSATWGIYAPRPSATLVRVRLVAGGGGGAGTSNQHFIPPGQYGKRGEDSMFGLHPVQIGMFAMTPTAMDCYINGTLEGSRAIVFQTLPPEVTGLAINTPYWPINQTSLPNNVLKFNLSATPFSPPFGGQTPMICGPLITNPSLAFHRVWYGVEGGGGGGIVGDQGTPLGSWGFADNGPNGEVQGEAYQGGTGLAYWRIGPPGGVNGLGGNSGSSYQDFGINGANLCGAGGGGAPPPVGTTAPGEWSGTSGAAGAWGDIEYVPTEGFIPWFWAAKGGLGGPAGPGGYPGGNGGNGMVRFWDYA